VLDRHAARCQALVGDEQCALFREHDCRFAHAQFLHGDLLQGREDALPEFYLADAQFESAIREMMDPLRKPRVGDQTR
jgi:hypothetical protein